MATSATSIVSSNLSGAGRLASTDTGVNSTSGAMPGNPSPNMAAWKEYVTTILALGIAGVSLYMLWSTFHYATSDDKLLSAHKDILLYGLSLFGTVLGYYFGRVPAELHAQQATAEANKAQGQLTQAQTATANALAGQQQTQQKVRDVLTTVKQNLLQAGSPPISNMKAALQPTGLQQAIAEIDEALKGI